MVVMGVYAPCWLSKVNDTLKLLWQRPAAWAGFGLRGGNRRQGWRATSVHCAPASERQTYANMDATEPPRAPVPIAVMGARGYVWDADGGRLAACAALA